MSIEFTCKIADFFGNSLELNSIREARAFVKAEADAWSWLTSAPHAIANMAERLSAYNTMLSWLDDLEAGLSDGVSVANNIRSVYQQNTPHFLLSDFWPGSAVLLVRQCYGDDEAERSFAHLVRNPPVDISDPVQFRRWQRIADPATIKPNAWLEDQRAKISSSRRALTAELARQGAESETLLAQLSAENLRAHQRLKRVSLRLLRMARARAKEAGERAESQIKKMDTTRAAYEEQMHLKAPVEYWNVKKVSHDKSASLWLKILVGFVIIAGIVVALTFNSAWKMVGDDKFSGKHFLIVAGIGALLTMIFWLARLIVRIYLGERHLATDAEERRVMTQAYLALIKDKAASDQDRVVILSALFRSAQDGIVKDDGGGSVSIPALLAAALDVKRGGSA